MHEVVGVFQLRVRQSERYWLEPGHGPDGHTFESCKTCRVLSAITSNAAAMVRYVGPYRSQCVGWWTRRADWRYTNTTEPENTTKLTTKAIQCPRNREALVTLPPSNGMTSAGQHLQAQIAACQIKAPEAVAQAHANSPRAD